MPCALINPLQPSTLGTLIPKPQNNRIISCTMAQHYHPSQIFLSAVPSFQPYLTGENNIAVQWLCIFLAGLVPSGENGVQLAPHAMAVLLRRATRSNVQREVQSGWKDVEQRNEGQWTRVRVLGLFWFCHKPARSYTVALTWGGCTHTAAEAAWVACQSMYA